MKKEQRLFLLEMDIARWDKDKFLKVKYLIRLKININLLFKKIIL